jgi:hypothetical protein
MAKLTLIIALLSLFFSSTILFSQGKDSKKKIEISSGNLYIQCSPGFKIYIDDVLEGITTQEEEGLFIKNISSGSHVIKIKKTGFEDLIKETTIVANKTTELDLSELIDTSNRKFTEQKLIKLIRNDGFYAFKTGIIDKNLFTANNEAYALLFFPNTPPGLNSTFTIYFGIIWVEEGTELEGNISKSWANIDGTCELSYENDKLFVYVNAESFSIDSKQIWTNGAWSYHYGLKGTLSEDGFSIRNANLKIHNKNSDPYDKNVPWELQHSLNGNFIFKTF